MPAFRRVFRAFPGFDVLTNIESVNILDIAPPGQVLGSGTGVVCLVGEFERGKLNTPMDILGTNDLLSKVGGLGLQIATNPHAGPVAVKSGGDELWNGNGFIWLSRKVLAGLVICRVDNSAGSVQFSRLASLTGGDGPFVGVVNGDTVDLTRDGVTVVIATWSATPGVIDGDGFPGDASIAWQVDDTPSGTAFVDVTTAFNDATSANLEPFPTTEAVGDYFAVGRASSTFDRITFDYAGGTAGVGGVVVWEYWNGSAWTALAGVSDATAGFTTAIADGLVVSWTVPVDWARNTISGVTAYYVRARITTVYTTNPVLDQGFVQGNNVTGFVGGETLEIRDGTDAVRVVVFTAADQTREAVRDRINATLASNVASVVGTQLRLSSTIQGALGIIEVVGGTARGTLGFHSTTQQQVMTLLVQTAGTTALWSASFQQVVNGVLTTYTATFTSDAAPTVTEIRDGLLADFADQGVPFVTFASVSTDQLTVTFDANRTGSSPSVTPGGGGTATFTTTTPAIVTIGRGTGNVPNIASIEGSDAAAVFDALAGIGAELDGDGFLRVTNNGTPATGTLQVTGGTVVTNFGFNTTDIADAGEGEDVTIPAGTRVQDASATGTIWVTLEDVETGEGGGPFDVKVRPFSDDDTALASTAGNVTLVLDTLPDGFSVTNSATITRLSASQLDARYQTALDATLGQSTAARKANIICAARASASIGRAVKLNAIRATSQGLAARKAIVRPLLGTTRDAAQASTGTGVGNIGRDERAVYAFPGFKTQIPEIAAVGAANGGTGFTDDGVIQVGSDSFYAQVRSILPPEEDAGQQLSDTNVVALNVLALEDAYDPDEGGVDLQIEDYIAFKAAGICAPRISRTAGAHFMSDVTSVDPNSEPAKVPANRRYFADFIMDTLGDIGLKFVKKLNTPNRNRALLQEIRGFLKILKSENQPETSRLFGFEAFDDTSDDQRAAEIVFIVVKVKMHPTMKFITYRAEVGPTVVIEEAA